MAFYSLEANDIFGNTVSMSTFKDQIVLIVNTATKCGYAPQFKGLQTLYERYKDEGLVILGFPSNQFMNQEPLNEKEIRETCSLNYGVSFPLFEKINVKGKNIHPVFKWLTDQKKGTLGKSIKWNFTKFLLDRKGHVVERFGPKDTPESFEDVIQALL